jgi:predicted nucleic acid-binding protein
VAFVLDASIALAWKIPDEHNNRPLDVLARLESESAVVPFHWRAEVANALLMAERRKRIDASQVAQFTAELAKIPLMIDHDGGETVFDRVLPLARAHALTIYDALYLELAERRGLSLASLDTDLRAAAQSVGVKTLP